MKFLPNTYYCWSMPDCSLVSSWAADIIHLSYFTITCRSLLASSNACSEHHTSSYHVADPLISFVLHLLYSFACLLIPTMPFFYDSMTSIHFCTYARSIWIYFPIFCIIDIVHHNNNNLSLCSAASHLLQRTLLIWVQCAYGFEYLISTWKKNYTLIPDKIVWR
jgi:hypothetical protein